MKKQNSIWGLWFGLGVLAGFLILVPFVSSILIIGQRLAVIHPGLDWLLYVLLLVLLYLLAVRPIVMVLFAPTISLGQLPTLPYRTKLKVARRLSENNAISGDAALALRTAIGRKALLDEPLLDFIAELDETALQKIDDRAILAFVSNAIVQNGRLEAIALLSVNIRLVHDLVDHYAFRPSLSTLMRIYGEVFVTAFLVEEVGDLDVGSALGMSVSPALGALPGFELMAHSLFQGATSCLLTLRVGMITRDILKDGLGSRASRHERRRLANREAASRVPKVFPKAMTDLTNALLRRQTTPAATTT
jgi:hypothetical protein